MAGDGGRVPDVSEQRAEVFTIRWDDGMGCYRVSVPMLEEARVVRVDDPASVLAALLAESPEVTVAAIEALGFDRARDGTVAVEDVERLKSELQALVDWFNEAPFLRAERLLYDLHQAERDLSYDELSKIERLRAQEQSRLEAEVARLSSPGRDTDAVQAENARLHVAFAEQQATIERLSSPERDTERLVEAVQRLVELKDHPNHDSISKSVKDLAWRHVREALAEFPASSNDKENGDA